ncbi:uncharacterized protein J3D65DRAFT_275686 [Phyllosticta citribraziliensis]|uniref:Uncharacterized protein n=1 Tax=Phyllosticta citribraziliensis TaxID=989973 RepID=A0ABR1LX44_9PEZI
MAFFWPLSSKVSTKSKASAHQSSFLTFLQQTVQSSSSGTSSTTGPPIFDSALLPDAAVHPTALTFPWFLLAFGFDRSRISTFASARHTNAPSSPRFGFCFVPPSGFSQQSACGLVFRLAYTSNRENWVERQAGKRAKKKEQVEKQGGGEKDFKNIGECT